MAFLSRVCCLLFRVYNIYGSHRSSHGDRIDQTHSYINKTPCIERHFIRNLCIFQVLADSDKSTEKFWKIREEYIKSLPGLFGFVIINWPLLMDLTPTSSDLLIMDMVRDCTEISHNLFR